MAPIHATAASVSASSTSHGTRNLLIAAAVGGAVAVSLGVYAKQHDPTNEQLLHVGFSSTLSMKVWLTTGVFALALAQAASAAWMWGTLPGAGVPPRWVRHAHRWTGTAAFLLALPVAYHCLWSLGWRGTDNVRVLAHGLLGCAFFGAMTTKLLALRIAGVSRYTLPVLGASLVTILTAIWLTSSLWFFTTVEFPGW